MKNYYLFSYDTYHPSGGFRDFVGRFDSFESLKEFLKKELDKRTSSNLHCYRDLIWKEVQLVEITDSDVKILISGISAEQLLNALKKNRPIVRSRFRLCKEFASHYSYFDKRMECIRESKNI